jgi:hypothetical protein
MEFPDNINVFDAVDFKTKVPRNTGRTTAELLVQARPTWRIADHYLLEAKPVLSSLFPDPKWMVISWSTSSGARTCRSGEI